MKINLYYNSSESNKIGKSLNKAIEFNGYLRDESRVVNPVITVKAKNLSSYNYCYIPEFNRYYFIDELVSVKNDLWRVSLHVDVLERRSGQKLSKIEMVSLVFVVLMFRSNIRIWE